MKFSVICADPPWDAGHCRHEVRSTGGFQDMRYAIIVADPPWRIDQQQDCPSLRGEGRGPCLGKEYIDVGWDRSGGPIKHYKTMEKDDLLNLDVKSLAAPTCALLLWTTSSHLPLALECAKAWGFAYKTTWCWVKTAKNGGVGWGMGCYVRNSHELVLICTKGACRKALRSKNERSVITTQRGKHSSKPELFQDAIERMWEGPYLELFARRDRPNWTCVGNQMGALGDRPANEDIVDSIVRLRNEV